MDAPANPAASRLSHGWFALGLVSAFALCIAFGLWTRYLPDWRHLWTDVVHDRNAHLEAGLALAGNISHGRLGEVVRDIDRARTWPPLHDGLMVASAVLVGGDDVRFAVLPSLICFAATAVLAFFTARRLVNANRSAAGAVAATLVLVSPALRAYATDVMVEGPGACLTVAALYAAVRVTQDGTQAAWRWLAASLTALFFLKYNYWLLVVLALMPSVAQPALQAATALPWQAVLRRQSRRPSTYVIATLLGVCAWVRLTGGGDLRLFGHTVNVRSNVTLASLAYWAVLARLIPWYWRIGRRLAAYDFRVRATVNGHVLPIALWLAWPQKMASFLWVLNPGSNVGEFPAADRWGGFGYYTGALTSDYHIAAWSAAAVGVLALAAVAAGCCGRLKPGWRAIVIFAALAAGLTATHPNRKSRFVHSWAPAVWVLAGAGWGAAGVRRLMGVAATCLIAAHAPGLIRAPHAPEGGVRRDRPSALDLTDAYLPALANAHRPAILSNVPLKFFARWTYLDRFDCGIRPVTDVPGFDLAAESAGNAAAFSQWLASTPCDVIVLIDLPADSSWYVPVPGCGGLQQLVGLMASQSTFRRTTTHSLAGATACVWRRPPNGD